MEHAGLRVHLRLAVLFLMVISAAAVEAADPVRYLDIHYTDDPALQTRLNTLDIYVPQGRTTCPVIVFIHGGYWMQGDKGKLDDKVRAFTDRGYLYASVNYRLSSDVMHPVHTQDVARAVAWIYRNISSYGGDPRSLTLMGHSAGGHIAALLATDPSYLAEYGLSPANLTAVIGLDCGAYYLPALFRAEPENDWILELAFGTDPAFWEAASPVNHVGPGEDIPPFFIVYAGDRNVSHEVAVQMAEALHRVNVTAELLHVPDKDHVSVERDIGKPDNDLADRIVRFIEARGRK